jgi:hypothetical protein
LGIGTTLELTGISIVQQYGAKNKALMNGYSWFVPVTDTYTVTVEECADGTFGCSPYPPSRPINYEVTYTYTVTEDTGGDEVLVSGETATGAIETPIDTDVYTFSATNGDWVTITASNPDHECVGLCTGSEIP